MTLYTRSYSVKLEKSETTIFIMTIIEHAVILKRINFCSFYISVITTVKFFEEKFI